MYGASGDGCALGGESFHLFVPCLCRCEPAEDLQGRVVGPPGGLVEIVPGHMIRTRSLAAGRL